jgi:hypothetical protein
MRKLAVAGVIVTILVASFINFTFSRAAIEQRPALEMIKWGNDYFEYPDWSASVTEKDGGASGSWVQAGRVFTRRYLPQYKPKSGEEMDSIIDDKYIKGTMVEYGDYELIDRCIVDDVVILEMEADSKSLEDTRYIVRQWFWSDEDGWTDTFAAFTKDHDDEMEELIDDIIGRAEHCK